ncbi:MAG: hypothetical protein ACI9WU_002415 [Myxococcota bacterium]|jgi:hypothetical protein
MVFSFVLVAGCATTASSVPEAAPPGAAGSAAQTPSDDIDDDHADGQIVLKSLERTQARMLKAEERLRLLRAKLHKFELLEAERMGRSNQ